MEHPAQSRMETLVNAIVKHYRTDFTEHDIAILESLEHSEPFVWFARESGTHLFSPSGIAEAKANGWHGYGRTVDGIAERDPNGSGWYLWNGSTFGKVSTQRARTMVEAWESNAPKETEEHYAARMKRGGW